MFFHLATTTLHTFYDAYVTPSSLNTTYSTFASRAAGYKQPTMRVVRIRASLAMRRGSQPATEQEVGAR